MLTGDILRHSARRMPGRVALAGDGRHLSYADFDEAANRLANAFLSMGLSKGDKVAILSMNRIEYAIAYFGIARTGLVSAHVSVRNTAEELAYKLNKVHARVLMFESQFLPVVQAALPRAPDVERLIVMDDCAGCEALTPRPLSFAEFIQDQRETEPLVDIDESDPVAITFTGGTTGFPKAVLVSHHARCASSFAAAIDFGLNEGDVIIASTPLFHTAGLFVWFATGVMLGTGVVILHRWDVEAFMQLIEREGVSAAFLVPTQLNALISHEAFDVTRLASLKKIGYAGSPMGRALFERVQTALPQVQFTENYGQSEACPITVRCPWHPAEKLGTVGRPAFNVDIRIVDPQGRELPRGETGEVTVSGEHSFSEYYGDPEQTAQAYRSNDGWLWTGDVGFLDEDGFLTLVDRSKDMLVSGGENVYPAEIENALYRHEAVAECAVFGIPDEKWGEVPAAHIVLARGVVISEQELIEFCASCISVHKRPRLIKFVDNLPRTPVGKIQKGLLRKPYWEGRERAI